jgi:hypothetical protein
MINKMQISAPRFVLVGYGWGFEIQLLTMGEFLAADNFHWTLPLSSSEI